MEAEEAMSYVAPGSGLGAPSKVSIDILNISNGRALC